MPGRQTPTEADDRRWNLSVQQQAAADLLPIGNTVTAVAEHVGVARQTVSPGDLLVIREGDVLHAGGVVTFAANLTVD